ncbi:MAG: radical SAM protein [candidate division Zixibacteria bacterium]|nr:radical SAM protein [candidate division Zixibacteria bacterium]
MKRGSTNLKVLLCTVFRRFEGDVNDSLGSVTRGIPRFSMPRDFNPGLRFIKQNVPEVEILEYPRWHEYVAKLKEGWDIVGFSFYQAEIDEIERMADEARRQGVGETWAGNYGALDGRVPQIVDRVVIGPGENVFAELFGRGIREDDVEVPPIIGYVRTVPGNIRHFAYGVLYTQRGCPYKCTFCQTPAFDQKRYHYSFESVDRVLRYYKQAGVNYIFAGDEFFGGRPEAADRITRLLGRYKFRWYCQTRAATALRYLDDWYERGMRFVHIGLESMNQDALDAVDKRQTVEEVYAFARRTAEKRGLVRLAACMIGFPNMTAEDTFRDALVLRRAALDIYTVSVLTPFPQTPLWFEIGAKYGISGRPYRHFDGQHLVWRHPSIDAVQMESLLKAVVGMLNRPVATYYRSLSRLFRGRCRGGEVSLRNDFWRRFFRVDAGRP